MRKHRWKMLLLLLFSVTLIGCSEKKDGESSKSEKFQFREGYKSERWIFQCHSWNVIFYGF